MNKTNNYSYSSISNFGYNKILPVNNPLSYSINKTMDQSFLHGSSAHNIVGQESKASQAFLSAYCANNWDEFCEFASQNTQISYPNNLSENPLDFVNPIQRTSGQQLIYNTAKKKYLKKMYNCQLKSEPFDPTVATSPLISYWVPTNNNNVYKCIPEYAVDPKTIDNDPVMSKIINDPLPYSDILINIYNTMKKDGTLSQLEGTYIGNYFSNAPYMANQGGLKS